MKVIDSMVQECILAMEMRKPIIVLKTSYLEVVQRIIESEEMQAMIPELVSGEKGWEPVENTCSNKPVVGRRFFRSNYVFLHPYRRSPSDGKYAGDDIAQRFFRFARSSVRLELCDPPHLFIIKGDTHDSGVDPSNSRNAMWNEFLPFIDGYTADYDRSTPIGRSQIILFGKSIDIPSDFAPYCHVVIEEYPDRGELLEMVKGIFRTPSSDTVNVLVDRLRGFPLIQVEQLLRYVSAQSGKEHMTVQEIWHLLKKEKLQLLNKNNLLELVEPSENTVVGMEEFGRIATIQEALLNQAELVKASIGVDSPKGILLCGIPGCGKSQAAKMFARETGLPMLKMDIGRLMGGLVGESEHNMEEALKLAEALSPCILFIDELCKGFEGAKSHGEGGSSDTFRRMFATLLAWMQEHEKPCYIFATANDISSLPKEFFRSGRFDCIYSLFMPRYRECAQILAYHMEKRQKKASRKTLFAFDVEKMAHTLVEQMAQASPPRFVTGADLEKLVELTLRSVWRTGEGAEGISPDLWLLTFQEELQKTSVYGDGNEQKDSIALCYIRLLHNNFVPLSDDPLMNQQDYVVTTEETSDNLDLPKFTVQLPDAKFEDMQEAFGGSASKTFDNRYDYELYCMIARRMLKYGPHYERKALGNML